MLGTRHPHPSMILSMILSVVTLAPALAQPVAGETLVLDINTTKKGDGGDLHSSPGPLAEVNGVTYFAANDGCHGKELWRTDGTPGGTWMVADIYPGAISSFPRDMSVLPGGTILFVAHEPDTGVELWKTDGTAAGTTLLKDINPVVYQSGLPTPPVVFKGRIWFCADDGTGDELWVSDGTQGGTFKFIDQNPAGAAHDYSTFRSRVVGDKLFFSRRFPSAELWVTDGTPAGTAAIASFTGIAGYQCLTTFGEANGRLVFDGWNGSQGILFRSDGTAAGTNPVAAVRDPAWFVTVGGVAYFAGEEPGEGYELFVTDATPAGTYRVADLAPGFSDGVLDDEPGLAIGTGIVFFGYTATAGFEPFHSDGTASGTVLLADTVPGGGSSFPKDLVAFGPNAVFNAANRPWITDGTPAGTSKLADVAEPLPMLECATGFLFGAKDDQIGRELWLTDGTPAGTQPLLDINAEATLGSAPTHLVRLGDRALFRADDGVVGFELWVSDGTAAGTALVRDIAPGPTDSIPLPLGGVGDVVLFVADDGLAGAELWRSDGTTAGTFLLKDIGPGPLSGLTPAGQYPDWFLTPRWCIHDDRLYFQATGTTGAEPWVSDGTPTGTVPIADLVPGSGGSDPTEFAGFGDHVYFSATTPATGYELWRTDGTAAGTQLVADIESGPVDSNPRSLVAVDDRLYFVATTGMQGSELWSHDASGGTAIVRDIWPGPSSGFYGPAIIALDDLVVFGGREPVAGAELWRSDGSAAGTYLLADLQPGPAGSSMQAMTAAGTHAYYSRGPSYTLHGTDGTVAGTGPIAPVKAYGMGPSGSSTFWRFGSGNHVLFWGYSYPHNAEPWITDGTAAGTDLLADLAPYEKWFSPGRGVRLGDRLLLTGDDGATGRELHVIPFGSTGGWLVEPYGTGCGAAPGGPRLGADGGPIPGTVFTIELDAAPASAPWLLYAALDQGALPVGSGCDFLLDVPFFLVTTAATDPLGSSVLPLPIPILPVLPGLLVDFQAIVLPGGGVPPPITELSNGLEIIIGS